MCDSEQPGEEKFEPIDDDDYESEQHCGVCGGDGGFENDDGLWSECYFCNGTGID